ncbi:MAG: SAM-dependent chlorinase/fluorinase [Verrucomicrobia bacterium]|nr:SAM-dependent chlorinase/fluorinase [Verrucomicrobiota bacterium]
MKLITLTTDFGLGDWFVGTMKGVILRISPACQIVDITHEIPAGDIRAGAFALAAAYRHFPRGTIHVAVVDPGVGSGRAVIAVRSRDYLFIGPDNGVLSLALARQEIKAIRRAENKRLFVQPVSQTFHGRDVLAPVAAHLSKGTPFRCVGPAVRECARLAWPEPEVSRRSLRGRVIYLDRFGNAITNITSERLATLAGSVRSVRLRGRRPFPVAPFYQAVPAGQPAGIVGSTGFLEIAVNGGSAAEVLRLKLGDAVMICSEKKAILRHA